MRYSPIILFVYNRPIHTQKTLEALSQNTLAQDSELFIFADGPKQNESLEQLEKINETRKIVHSKKWCKKNTIIESKVNKGLATSIISGVTDIIDKYGTAIVLEDDIVTGRFFLEFMNESLSKYKDNKDVMHITGWRDPVKRAKNDSCFFYPTMDCWSWATWKDRWQYFKKDALYYKSIFTKKMIYDFNIEGSDPGMWCQIEQNIEGKINTWAIFWYASIFLRNGLCLAPTKSLCKNIGFDNSGVHCGANESQEIRESIDYKVKNFPSKIKTDRKEFIKNKKFLKYVKYNRKFSIKRLIKSFIPKKLKTKIKSYLSKKNTL